MSVHAAVGGGNYLSSGSNLSNPVSQTKLIWYKLDNAAGGYDPVVYAFDGSFANVLAMAYNTALSIEANGTTYTPFGSQPTATNWNCMILTGAAAGAGSANAYWQDNAGGGFKTVSSTGTGFTNVGDLILGASLFDATTVAYYMEWGVVLSGAEMNAQFLSPTPVVQPGNLRRYLALTNAATAANDTSGNGFNMTVFGSFTDGASLPTFPALGVRRRPRIVVPSYTFR